MVFDGQALDGFHVKFIRKKARHFIITKIVSLEQLNIRQVRQLFFITECVLGNSAGSKGS